MRISIAPPGLGTTAAIWTFGMDIVEVGAVVDWANYGKVINKPSLLFISYLPLSSNQWGPQKADDFTDDFSRDRA